MSRYSPRARLTNTTSTAAVANWFGNQFVALPAGNYESISTLTVGSGGASSIEFTSIPSTYTHLQIRGIARSTNAATASALATQINSDTGSNYFQHGLYAGSGTVAGYSLTSTTSIGFGYTSGNTATANGFSGHVIDFYDYKDTNKIKTYRGFSGYDNNAGGQARIVYGSWNSTSAITSIKIYDANGANLAQYTTFALYGIKVS